MIRLFLLITAVIGLMWLFSRLGSMAPHQRAKYAKIAALWAGGAVLLVLILTGKLHPLFAAIGAAFPWIQRIIMMRSAYQMFSSWRGPAQGAAPGQTSEVKTKYLEMLLDHDTGEIQGSVIRGPRKDSALEQLKIEELAELMDLYRTQDKQSASLLHAYLDKMRADEWDEYVRKHAPEDESAADRNSMTQAEALEILGLDDGATREEIVEAHRLLMQRNHPDRGGSTWLAARINRAKDLLLSQSA